MADDPFSIVDHQLPYSSHNTYSVRFYESAIHTTVTHDSAVVSRWISDIEDFHRLHHSFLIVGFHVEWCPSFNDQIQNRVALVQLCVGQHCLIFQLIYCGSIPSFLVNFLSNPIYTFVGIGIKQDLEVLENDYQEGLNVNAVDLRLIAAEVFGRNDLGNAGLKMIASVVLSKELEEPRNVTLSPWDSQQLSLAQVQYACIDAFVCFEIGRILNDYSNFAS